MNPLLFREKENNKRLTLLRLGEKCYFQTVFRIPEVEQIGSHIDCSSEPIRRSYKIYKEELTSQQSSCHFKKFQIILLKTVDVEIFYLSLFFEDRLIQLYIVMS